MMAQASLAFLRFQPCHPGQSDEASPRAAASRGGSSAPQDRVGHLRGRFRRRTSTTTRHLREGRDGVSPGRQARCDPPPPQRIGQESIRHCSAPAYAARQGI